jgi:two-component system response regulator HydG
MGDKESACANVLQEQQVPTEIAQCDLELQQLRSILDSTVFLGGLIGSSPAIRAIHQLIVKTIDRDFQVLIMGETGTGKELVARCIHYSGTRKNCPFVAVDCSALAPTLFESELFGCVRGAFTGATRDRKGLFQAADTGTIFLDEIGELRKELQGKLLRAVQEGEVRRLGSTETLPVDVRIIAATNRDLKQAVEKGEFREDLYYRLNVFQITVPPLRQRRADIPLLVAAFLKKYDDPSRPITGIAREFWTELMGYEWRGNVRELESLVERSIALGSGPILRDEDECRPLWQTGQNIERRCAQPLSVVEKHTILAALNETGGDKVAAARILGIGRTTLYRKMKEYRFSTLFQGQAVAESSYSGGERVGI